MKTFECNKCKSTNIFIKENGNQTGLYCSECGAWIKWVGKDERRLAELQIERSHEVEEEEPEVVDLSQFSDEELLEEIRRRMR